ncbi:aminoacyl-tRNA hydrolase [Vicingus serpentipes]|jgi:peptidyl-tRNA hydrolase, PTH1 family|uniref:Peptidyl-tRNA hydrolase n=1 Tax=Vicingus serpentipes TaxID=1926625 RepID=A0A5C6RS56_9FLAO|nr:aminoacyl-tRNA hydrolase [Vicingus serpentipes]TXB65138.1 aminoacyl-tRNA hydrolase [Vicingus serpentipes]
MKYLIVGLGNIGSEYENTRHNIGFKILDALASASNIFFEPNKLGSTATLKFKGRTLILVKPSTYMNLSGKAVNYYLQQEKIKQENLLVITDDIALPFGTIRLKGKGSDGGHNGLKNIFECLGNANYPRLRFGVGSDFVQGKQINYVLGDFAPEEQSALPERLEKATQAIKAFTTIGLGRTMSDFNGK